MLYEHYARFRAMGTQVVVIAVSRPGSKAVKRMLERVEGLFRQEEARFSRFRLDSELSRLNQRDMLKNPSAAFWEVLLRARKWWELTGGDFDPTVLAALEMAGYDRSFADLPPYPAGSLPPSPVAQGLSAGFQEVKVEEGHTRRIQLTGGVRLDFGGIVKGWTVDQAAQILAPLGDYLIDAGGDIFAAGDSADGEGWWVAVEDPHLPLHDLGYLVIRDQALATSGTYRRRWLDSRGRLAHHLIDPRSGAPSSSDVIGATVLGASVESCEVYAKVALLRGARRGIKFLEEAENTEGMLVSSNGARLATTGWPSLFPPEDGSYDLAYSG